jgi:hypothetical protein
MGSSIALGARDEQAKILQPLVAPMSSSDTYERCCLHAKVFDCVLKDPRGLRELALGI